MSNPPAAVRKTMIAFALIVWSLSTVGAVAAHAQYYGHHHHYHHRHWQWDRHHRHGRWGYN